MITGPYKASLRGPAHTVREADNISQQQWHIHDYYRNITVIFPFGIYAQRLWKRPSVWYRALPQCVCVWSPCVNDASRADSQSIRFTVSRCRSAPACECVLELPAASSTTDSATSEQRHKRAGGSEQRLGRRSPKPKPETRNVETRQLDPGSESISWSLPFVMWGCSSS